VLCYSGHLAGLSPWGLLGLPLWLACGCLVHTSVLVLASTVVVKVKGSYNQLFWLTNTLLQNSRYPLSIYPGAVQAVLLVLVPFGLACFVPVSALTGRLPWALALGAPPVAAAIMVSLAWWAWEKAFQGYESTGS